MIGTEISPETLALLRLSLVPGLGARTIHSLVESCHSAASILQASHEKLMEVPGVGPKILSFIQAARNSSGHEEVLRWCDSQRIQVRSWSDPDYPEALKHVEDAPPVLYIRGAFQSSDAIGVAIVGSRHATQYGIRQAGKIARDLGRAGVTVVSGLARGIDAAAHRGAMEGGGRTIAVLGGGFAHLYPPEHGQLADEIAACGAVVTEYPPHEQPKGSMFPQRNRIISGLSQGVLVIEAAARSGSLITARHAGEQGRGVFALPGPVTSRVSKGCHALIRDGAQLATCADDILEQLGPMAVSVESETGDTIKRPAELLLTEQERIVLSSVAEQPTQIDQVIRLTKLPAPRVLSTISVLESKRLIRRLSGQYVARI